MNSVVWAIQVILASIFAAAGGLKLTRTREQLRPRMGFVVDYSDAQVKAIGAIEVLGAVGVVLPAWTGIAPVLTPVAAVGLAIVMVLAALDHLRRKEPRETLVPAVLFLAAVFVAVMRFGPYAY